MLIHKSVFVLFDIGHLLFSCGQYELRGYASFKRSRCVRSSETMEKSNKGGCYHLNKLPTLLLELFNNSNNRCSVYFLNTWATNAASGGSKT